MDKGESESQPPRQDVSRQLLDQMGGVFWAANVAGFDDVSEVALAAAPLVHEDVLHDRQQETPAVTFYL